MELQELLDNPDYVNANQATRRAIFEKYSRNNSDYVNANSETRQAIHERFGLSKVTEPLPEKITDFSARDFGNLVKQSMGQANEILAETSKQTGRTPVVGPAVMAGVGETIKSIGAVGELATDYAQPVTQFGQTITEGAKEINPVSGTVGQVGSYIAPYKLASKVVANTAGRIPYIRGAVNPATVLGSTGEMAASGALVGGLTTPGDYEERMREAGTQAMMGGGVNLALRGAPAVYQGGKQIATGGREGLINKTWNENPNTAFSTMGDTIYPNTTVKPWQQMTPQQRVAGLPELEASKVSSDSLFNTTGAKIAKTFAPKSPNPGEILVPYQGKTLQAFGENLGRDFANQPVLTSAKQLAAPVIGGLLGGPAGLVAGLGITGASNLFKMAELASLAKLGKTAALQPGFAQELKAAQAAAKSQQAFTPPNQNVGKAFTAPGQTVPGPVTAINPAQMQPIPQTTSQPWGSAPPPTNPAEISKLAAAQQLQRQMGGLTNKTNEDFMSAISKPILETEATVAGTAPQLQKANDIVKQQQSWKERAGVTLPGETKTTKTIKTRTQSKTKAQPEQVVEEPTTSAGKVEAMVIEKGTKAKTFGEQFNETLSKFNKAKEKAKAEGKDISSVEVEFNGKYITDIGKKDTKFKPNSDFELTHYIDFNPAFNFGKKTYYGVEKSTNTPIRIINEKGTLLHDSPAAVVEKQLPNGNFEFYKAYNRTGDEIHYDFLGNRGKAAEKQWGKQNFPVPTNVKTGFTPEAQQQIIANDIQNRLDEALYKASLADTSSTTSTPSKKGPSNVSQMMVGEPKTTGPLEQSLVSKRSFNGDLQKYRYGTEKSPLTLEEYNHLKNSEFIDKQNTRDIIMGMRPELTEYSIWYKDKSGKIQNIQTYGNEFKKK